MSRSGRYRLRTQRSRWPPGIPEAEKERAREGLDASRGAFALATPVAAGDRIRLVRADSRVARENLRADLEGLPSGRSGLGLYFSCPSRGARLFEHEGLESGYLAGALGPAPLLGMMGAFQLAPDPRGAAPLLHTYSGVLARLEDS